MLDTITNVHTFDQPIETSVKVGMEIDSKGQKKPSVEIKISRKLTVEQMMCTKDGTQTLIDMDIQTALAKCKDTIKKSMEV